MISAADTPDWLPAHHVGDADGISAIPKRSVASLFVFCQGEAELSPPE